MIPQYNNAIIPAVSCLKMIPRCTLLGAGLGLLCARVVTQLTNVSISGDVGSLCFGTIGLVASIAFSCANGDELLKAAKGASPIKVLKLCFTAKYLPFTLLTLGVLPLASYASTLGASKIALLALSGCFVLPIVGIVDGIGRFFLIHGKPAAVSIAGIALYRGIIVVAGQNDIVFGNIAKIGLVFLSFGSTVTLFDN
jgi:hypothetical protein